MCTDYEYLPLPRDHMLHQSNSSTVIADPNLCVTGVIPDNGPNTWQPT